MGSCMRNSRGKVLGVEVCKSGGLQGPFEPWDVLVSAQGRIFTSPNKLPHHSRCLC